MAESAETNKKKKRRLNPWLIVGAVVIVLAIVAALVIMNPLRRPGGQGGVGGGPGESVGTQATLTVGRGTIIGTVSGSGTIQPEQTLDIAFQNTGTVTDVLVKEGDVVKQGQALAKLDTRDLESKVTSAQASLDSAKATLQQKQSGNGTTEAIASAQAAVDSAQAAYDKTAAGATPAELAAAKASVASAQAAYNAAAKTSDAGDSTLLSLKAALDKAQVALQQAQSAYDKIAWRSDVGMSQESKDLQNATIDYNKALSDYNAQQVTSGPNAQSSIASALSTLQAAKKTLADLTVTPDELASAKATVESAKANLAALTMPASASDLTIAQANVTNAEQTLQQAQLSLQQATLTAPFGGVVTAVNIVPGSTATGTVMSLMDTDPLHVDLKLSENDVVKATVDQTVNLSSDALSGWKEQGKVNFIAPSGTTSNGVVTYVVRVNFTDTDPRIRVGMTLNVDIVTAEKDNVVVVPNAALLPEGNGHAVQVVNPDGTKKTVPVETGISDATQTEIISGLTEGQRIVALPSSGSTRPGGGGPGPF